MKYNWSKLKLEYFLSKHTSVKNFFQDHVGAYSGHIKTKTIGWSAEKENYCLSVYEQAIESNRHNFTSALEVVLESVYQEVFLRCDKLALERYTLKQLRLIIALLGETRLLYTGAMKDKHGTLKPYEVELTATEKRQIHDVLRQEGMLP